MVQSLNIPNEIRKFFARFTDFDAVGQTIADVLDRDVPLTGAYGEMLVVAKDAIIEATRMRLGVVNKADGYQLRVILTLRAVCKRWAEEYHCCHQNKRQTGTHSEDCPYVAGCKLVGLDP